MRLKIYDAAGATDDFWYEIGPISTTSTTRTLQTTRAEILSGPLAGKTLIQRWSGVFDQRTGETYEATRVEMSVDGVRRLAIDFDPGFRNVEADWQRAYRRGIDYEGNAFANVLTGGEGDDRLFGGDGRDVLESYKGDDRLDGGPGRDVMRGGEGDDLYIVDRRDDVVIEESVGGTDTVRASASFALGFGIERLIQTGKADIGGRGNELDNLMRGNPGDNRLSGDDGDDRIEGRGGDDRLFGEAGDDILFGGSGDDALDGGEGADRLEGGAGRDRLFGGEGADVLAGGRGRDELFGGPGDDLYFADGRDRIFETRDGGYDTVESRGDFRLSDNIEALTLTGGRAADGWGNEAANAIRGNDADNRLFGGGGSDTISGGGGDDRIIGGPGDDRLLGQSGADTLIGGDGYDGLVGGAGRDVFAFRLAKEPRDYYFSNYIEDFEPGRDRIDLSLIDADQGSAGRQGFVFLGDRPFSGAAGELRFAAGRVVGDLDGDFAQDFDIEIRDFVRVGADDLIL